LKLAKPVHLVAFKTKILILFTLSVAIVSCNTVKNVPNEELLLTKNTIIVDSVETKDTRVHSLPYQRPNSRSILRIPFGLHFYNIADAQPDSTYQRWLNKSPKREKRLTALLSQKQVDGLGRSYVGFNKWIQETGEAPVIISKERIEKSVKRIKRYYASLGWFNVDVTYKIHKNEEKEKRGEVEYKVSLRTPYNVGTIEEKISSPVVDSLYQISKNQSFIEPKKQYAAYDFVNERERITVQMRNSGLYYFDQDYVGFEADTVNTNHNANITLIIPDRTIPVGDTTTTKPFEINTINEVRIVTDYSYANRNKTLKDSVTYNGYKLYSYDELKFKPKAITDAIAIHSGEIFKDIDRALTYNQIRDLKIFKYPNISYQEDPKDSTGTGLITTILLSPRKKYALGIDFDTYTSTIQQFGIGFKSTFLIRNIFRRAESFEVTGRGSVGSSKDAADSDSKFFNISDIGIDLKLSFPRILFPIKTEKWIPKFMGPSTNLSTGFSTQRNIGLDKQTMSAIYNYTWKPRKIRTNHFDLFNLQYVRNLNTDNYYNVYTNSYDRLNEIATDSGWDFYDMESENPSLQIPDEVNDFITTALDEEQSEIEITPEDQQDVLSIAERQLRLSENNLIFATNFTWIKDTRENVLDKNFSRTRFKIETAGNLFSAFASLTNASKDANGNYKTWGVVFSQYIKFETEYIKHWDFNRGGRVAVRAFGGIAIPYGNSSNIPFTRSYFAGGSNDNRGWQAYDLGPGSSGDLLDYNEANFKLAFNAEYRFNIIGSINGALFADVGNIWNALDDITDPAFKFEGIGDLKELAVATGFGIRYDFGFFVMRFDIGFKTHDPAYPEGERWFKDYNFSNAVYNFGINYPF